MERGRTEHHSEWLTRKRRIDPRLDALGWSCLRPGSANRGGCHRTEEEETDNGPADYALWLDGDVAAVVEAKKLTVGPQNVLVQAERYARGLRGSPHNFNGLRTPFLYSTNGEVIWFHDVRYELNRSRRVADFHTPNALRELLGRDLDAASAQLLTTPNDQPRLRPYQRDANEAIERAIAERKRHMLLAMATGTGKTFTLVNQIYRLMKSGVGRRVLFLVDRRALAAQAVRSFASFEAEPGQKFDAVYEIYSSRFQREDFGEEDRFDPKVLPSAYLTDPKPGLAFVYVCTVQRMAINLFGRAATLWMAVRFLVLHRDRSIRLMTEGLGPKPFHGRIVMLVNEHTLSAGEMVGAFAAENGLAKIVGTRTGGQVLGGGNFSVGHGFVLRFPAAGWYTWGGAVVEGKGVEPDIEVPLSVEGLRHGRDNQLETAITTIETMPC